MCLKMTLKVIKLKIIRTLNWLPLRNAGSCYAGNLVNLSIRNDPGAKQI